jgi:hypothetical protein
MSNENMVATEELLFLWWDYDGGEIIRRILETVSRGQSFRGPNIQDSLDRTR